MKGSSLAGGDGCGGGLGGTNGQGGAGSTNAGGGGGFGSGSGNTSSSGALICTVVTSSPAQEGGLAEGDVITSLNGHNVASPSGLTTLLGPFHPGDTVTIGWSDSSGQSHTASVQLSSGPPQ